MTDRFVCFDAETTGLFPWEGNEITYICAKDNEGQTFTGTTESQHEDELLISFKLWLEERKDHLLITFNGRSFDIPFFLARASMNNLKFVKTHHHLFLDMRQLDLIEMLSRRLSLNDYASLFGCKKKTGTSLNAIQLYRDRRFDELAKYCMNDVDVTIEVYQKLKINGILPPQEATSP